MNQLQLPKPEHRSSYINVPGHKPLLGLTIGQIFDQAIKNFPNNEALVISDLGIRKTFFQLKNEVDSLASGLLSFGLTKGDRIGIWGPNSYEYYLTQMAAWKAGLILVNINSACQPLELQYCISNVEIQALVIAPNFKTQNYYQMVTQIIPEVTTSKSWKLQSAHFPAFFLLITMDDLPKTGTITLKEVMEKGQTNNAKVMLGGIIPTIQFDDIINIQFTSGTTGNPKGASLTHHNIVNNSYFLAQRFQFQSRDKICLTVPLFHCYGSVIGTLVALQCGASIVIPSAAFSGKATLDAVIREKCTIIYGTPTMHIAVMNTPGFESYGVSTLRFACTGGSVCPQALISEMKSKYRVDTVGSVFGMTECSPVTFASIPSDTEIERAETVGYPMEHTEVKVIAADGRIVPIGSSGELCIRGYLTMAGYYGDIEKTNLLIQRNRWLHTGDLVTMRETGHVCIVGRIKDTIIRGGENIYPKEVEDLLHRHPAVAEANVFGLPDYRMGEEVATWILLRSGIKLTEDDVRNYCKGKISHYKIPKYIFFVKEFPKTISGKLQKYKIKEETLKLLEDAKIQ